MEQSAWAGVALLIKALDGSQFGLLLLAMVLPPVLIVIALFLLREEIRRRETADKARFEEVVKMYENNVLLVKSSEKTADGLQTVIHLSTQAITRMIEKIDNNHYCPILRERRHPHHGE